MEGPEDPFTAVNSNMFPYGTTEQFPLMEDSDQNVVTQSAHDYRYLSNYITSILLYLTYLSTLNMKLISLYQSISI
jgi:hypothetical protein